MGLRGATRCAEDRFPQSSDSSLKQKTSKNYWRFTARHTTQVLWGDDFCSDKINPDVFDLHFMRNNDVWFGESQFKNSVFYPLFIFLCFIILLIKWQSEMASTWRDCYEPHVLVSGYVMIYWFLTFTPWAQTSYYVYDNAENKPAYKYVKTSRLLPCDYDIVVNISVSCLKWVTTLEAKITSITYCIKFEIWHVHTSREGKLWWHSSQQNAVSLMSVVLI